MTQPAVRFADVSRVFGSLRAVDHVSFDIAPGEFFALLGPSGSGKTTCLRLIAGFEQPDGGRIEIDGRNVTGIPPFRRNVNTVFQDYALFPHLSVGENVEYSLMIRRIPAAERRKQAIEALDMVRLSGLEGRKPAQLSGGQRQRVALARALVNRPKILLLDEPLGALDLKLREAMQLELKSLQRSLGISFIFVTHDQGEALSMSDRLAVFNQGRIEQMGAPQDIYHRPDTAFVADFVGSANLIDGDLAMRLTGKPGIYALRPEKIRLGQGGDLQATGHVTDCQFLGGSTRLLVTLEDGSILHATLPGDAPPLDGPVQLSWNRADMRQVRE